MGGLWNRLPLLAFFFILSSLGSAAVPGLNGFVGEFPILVGMFAAQPDGRRAGRDRHDPGRLLPALDAPARHLRPAPRAARPRPRDGPRPRPARSARSAGTRSPAWRLLMVLIVVIGVYPAAVLRADPPGGRDRSPAQASRPAASGRPGLCAADRPVRPSPVAATGSTPRLPVIRLAPPSSRSSSEQGSPLMMSPSAFDVGPADAADPAARAPDPARGDGHDDGRAPSSACRGASGARSRP